MKKEFGYVTDREGNAVAGAEVYVRKQSDNTLLTLYSDNGSTTTANPLVTDNDGEYSFYTADNVIKVQTFVDGVQQQEVNNVQHYDLSVITAAAWTILDDATVGDIRTTLGVGTGDSPQFTAVNLGHASDTTLTRTGAGDIAIEGNAVYRAGGTDVPLADGGTGASLADPDADRIMFWDDSAGAMTWLAPSTGLTVSGTDLTVNSSQVKPTESFIIACSDETTALTAGTSKVTLRMPYAFTVTAVYASLTTAQTSGSIFTVDINEGGTSILSTKLTIDNGEDDSDTAATPAVISDSSLAARAKITVDIDQIGDGTAKGLKVTLVGTRT